MNTTESVTNKMKYGRKLVSAGISGIRNGSSEALNGQSVPAVLADAARESVKIAAVGACAGLVCSYFLRRRGRQSHTLALGLLGTAIGFGVGLSLRSRHAVSGVAHSAMREMRRASDEHWLESNPIDYA